MRGAVVTIGTYDGVHLGHQAILEQVSRSARETGAERVACIFPIPPRRSIHPTPSPHLILPLALRKKLLSEYVDRIELLDFTALRDLQPREFVEEVLIERLNVGTVVVGSSFRFAKDRAGTVETLTQLGPELGFEAQGLPPVYVGQEPVSSTRIRRQIGDGHVEDAAQLLGRPPLLVGRVVRGKGVGRTLGFPTANLDVHPHILLPADGVYAAHAFWGRERVHALLYVGRRPTLGGEDRLCEVHVLTDRDIDLYSHTMEIHVRSFLREDRRFASLEALSTQIRSDVEHARAARVKHPLRTDPISG